MVSSGIRFRDCWQHNPAIAGTMVALTKRLIDATTVAPRDTFVWDNDVRGFGLKITSAGRKIFILQYRMGGRETPHRYTIGPYGSLTPAQARDIAEDLKHQISKGIDPMIDAIRGSGCRKLTYPAAITPLLASSALPSGRLPFTGPRPPAASHGSTHPAEP
jgi:hypothetical protein